MVAVGGHDEAALAARSEVVLAHQAADLLGVDDIAAVAQLGVDPAVAIGFELIADRLHLCDDLGVRSFGGGFCIVG